jgi:hypothetical protein
MEGRIYCKTRMQERPVFPLPFYIKLEVLVIQQGKNLKHPHWKRRSKIIIFRCHNVM